MTIYSVVVGNNADLISHIAPLYIPKGSVVADVTWGKGAFWSKTDTSSITLHGSDIAGHIGGHNGIVQADFRSLPYEDHVYDVVVLDPPYIHNPGKHVTDKRYNNLETTKGMYHRDIRALYVAGMTEAVRILKPGGHLLVKGKDEVESGRQCWSHAELREDAESMGLYARDFFILVPQARTSMNRWSTQKHARKVHSFLWVFDKPAPKPPKPSRSKGAPAPKTAISKTPVPQTSKEAVKLIESLFNTYEMSWKQICQELGVADSTMWDWRKRGREMPSDKREAFARLADRLRNGNLSVPKRPRKTRAGKKTSP